MGPFWRISASYLCNILDPSAKEVCFWMVSKYPFTDDDCFRIQPTPRFISKVVENWFGYLTLLHGRSQNPSSGAEGNCPISCAMIHDLNITFEVLLFYVQRGI